MNAPDTVDPVAPPRRRRWIWKVLIPIPTLILVGLAVLFVLAWLRAGRVIDAQRQIVSTRLAALKSERVTRPVLFDPPEEGNCWELLSAALESIAGLTDEDLDGFPSFSLVEEVTPNPERIDAALVKVRPHLEMLKQALRRSWVEPGYTYENLLESPPGIGRAIRSSKVMADATAHLHSQGRTAEAVDLMLIALGIGDRMAVKGFLVHEMVGVVCRTLALESLMKILATHKFTAQDLQRLADGLQRLESGPLNDLRWIAREDLFARLVMINLIDQQLLGTSMDTAFVPSARHYFSLRIMLAESFEVHEAFAQRMETVSAAPLWERAAASGRVVREFGTNPTIMHGLLLPQFGRAWHNFVTSASQHRQAQLAVALARHREERGSFPRTLSDLVPEFLRAIPVDPLAGVGFGYLLREGEDTAVVYSWGRDRDDDQGRPAPDEDPDADDCDIVWKVRKGK